MTNKKKRSQKQEKSIAKAFNAKTVVASGAKWGAKGDVRNDKFLIECKTTQEDHYRVTSKVWEKIQEEATRDHIRIPLLIVDLQDKERYVVFRPTDFEKGLPKPYTCEGNIDTILKSYRIKPKSYRIKSGDLKESEDILGEYIYGHLFIICGKRRNMLFYMREKDFQETFKEELNWD